MKVGDEDMTTEETVNPSASRDSEARDEEDSSSSPQSAQKSE